MSDCKNALVASNGDMNQAIDWLRKKGVASAAKKSGRVTAEGLIGLASANSRGALVEVNTETDFVARNALFQKLTTSAAAAALELSSTNGDLGRDTLLQQVIKNIQDESKTQSLQEAVTQVAAVVGENVQFRRGNALSVKNGVVGSYLHAAVGPGIGKMAALVALDSDTQDKQGLTELGNKIAMHIVAAKPSFLTREEVPSADLQREKDVLLEQGRKEGKTDAILDKLVQGRLSKYYEQVVLLDQKFLITDKPDKKVSKVLEEASKKWNSSVKISAFSLYSVGEGIEKKQSDFAEEVQKQLQ
eukprot:GILK01002460.1.p1 GENE.GILK01002460.1~~GILK01002460.1.p1  ORF type:complete len:354 (+),score=68.10 GILK01002460.1:158-1063(+)